jgi:phenylacetate-CoA ligase
MDIPYQKKIYSLGFLLQSQHWSLEKIQELQLEGLKEITDFARLHCPYYKDLPKIRSLDDVDKLPILTKTDIRNNFDKILYSPIPHEIEETGGTVSRVRVAKDLLLVQRMGLQRFETWYGLNKDTRRWRRAHLWGSVEGANFTHDSNYLWMPIEQLDNRATAEKYLKALDIMSPDFFHGYALALANLAHYANEMNIHPACHVIRTECETLTSAMRSEIEEAFISDKGLFNLYGSRDLGAMAQDCSKHEGLHIQAERYIIESVQGRLLYTDMLNYAFPLIRYENQDVGEFDTSCSCNINLPTLKPVVGRVLQYLLTKRNLWVSAFIFYLPINYYDLHHNTKTFDWIESFQIRQREVGKVTLLMKPWSSERPPTDLNPMRNIINQYIKSEDFDYDIEIVNSIPLSRSGKQISVDTTLLREWDK